MSKGIYRIINTYNNSQLLIRATENLEKAISDFENGIMPNRRLENYKFKESLRAEVVEITDELAERYAFYTWPQLSKLFYSKECMSMSLDRIFSKKIKNAVDWLIETFHEPQYTFEMYIWEGELAAKVLKDGMEIERYVFESKKGGPTVRICIE